MGNLFKLAPIPQIETPEALFLGLSPDQAQLRQGPLTISSFGVDPPDRSTHFHLSLMSFDDGAARSITAGTSRRPLQISEEEQREVLRLTKKLNSKVLTIVEGEGTDHGLVWEGLGDIQTTSAASVSGQLLRPHLPEGDADIILRRFIDDSINLLSEIEMNERRRDEELPTLNLLWPWGNGVRLPVPNLALRRGVPARVFSASMRLQGLSRLAGYRHADRSQFGGGLSTHLEAIAEQLKNEQVSIVLIEAISTFRSQGQFEEADWFIREVEDKLFKPVFDASLREPTQLTILAPGSLTGQDVGLGVSFETGDSNNLSIPFDERALDERLPLESLWESVDRRL